MANELVATESTALFHLIAWSERVGNLNHGKLKTDEDNKIKLYLNHDLADLFKLMPWSGLPRVLVHHDIFDLFRAAPWTFVRIHQSDSSLEFAAGRVSNGMSVFSMFMPVDAVVLQFLAGKTMIVLTDSDSTEFRYIRLISEKESDV